MTTTWGLFTSLVAVVMGATACALTLWAVGPWRGPLQQTHPLQTNWWLRWIRSALQIQAVCALASLCAMLIAFGGNDFGSKAVSRLSNSALPLVWRLDAAFADLAAPLLLASATAAALAAAWAASATTQRALRPVLAAAFAATAALAAMLALVQPFERWATAPSEGMGLAIARQSAWADALPGHEALGVLIIPASPVYLLLALLAGGLAHVMVRRAGKQPGTGVEPLDLSQGPGLSCVHADGSMDGPVQVLTQGPAPWR